MKEPLNGRFDIFIAYYGNSETGSERSAKYIYDLIHNREIFPGKRIQAYFHPETNRNGSFESTPEFVDRTPLFLLVADKNIPRDDNNKLIRHRKNGTRSNLYQEVRTFYSSLMHTGYENSCENTAKVYISDNMSPKIAEELHPIFKGTNVVSNEQELLDWIYDFYRNLNPLRVSTECKRMMLEDRDRFLRGAWLDEALEIWNTTRDERIARTLIIYYLTKIDSGDTQVAKPMAILCSEISKRNDLDLKTKTLLTRAATELKKLADRRG